MNLEVLSPGVKHGEEADLGSEMLGIGRDRLQGLCRDLEENTVDDLLILVSDRGDLFRQGEDYMVIGDVQKFGLPILDPFSAGQTLAFRAVPIAAAIERVEFIVALITAFEVAAENRRVEWTRCRAHLAGGGS